MPTVNYKGKLYRAKCDLNILVPTESGVTHFACLKKGTIVMLVNRVSKPDLRAISLFTILVDEKLCTISFHSPMERFLDYFDLIGEDTQQQ